MKKSDRKFSLLKPALLADEEAIRGWFTLKNGSYRSENQKIPGLNLGFNASEKKETVRKNRAELFEDLGVDPDWVAFGEQVHSSKIQTVSQGGTYTSTDGLITQIPGLTLAIQVADCAAVLVWDAKNRVVGAFHAGWRGAVGEIVPRGVEQMEQEGAEPGKMEAYISPCISREHFEVGNEVAEQFPDGFVEYEMYSKPHVDLKGFLHYQLVETGISSSNIEVSGGCTINNEDQFYSYRREGDESGRMMGLIQIAENEN